MAPGGAEGGRDLARGPVATRLDGEELEDEERTAHRHDISSVVKRLHRRGDPWAGMGRRATSLARARNTWVEILTEDHGNHG
jgi:DNA primase